MASSNSYFHFFSSFKATILLEEVEILLGIKSSSNGEVACPLGEFYTLDVLEEFMSEKDAKSIITPNGLDLFKLFRWLISQLFNSSVDSLVIAKGLSICLVRSILFPSTRSFLHKSNVGIIREIWRGKFISHSVLAFLYSGHTITSTGHTPYDSVILLSLWMVVHLCFKLGLAFMTSRIFQKSVTFIFKSLVNLSGVVVAPLSYLKT